MNNTTLKNIVSGIIYRFEIMIGLSNNEYQTENHNAFSNHIE